MLFADKNKQIKIKQSKL